MNSMTRKIIFFSLLTLGLQVHVGAQEQGEQDEVNVDLLQDVSSEFKEKFFNALTEKAKENHNKAINILLECEELEPNAAIIQFELAKNYEAISAFAKAEQSLLRAIEIDGKREWVLDKLYDVYDKQQKFDEGLEILEELTQINPIYEELLPYQYYRTQQYQKCVDIIDKLDKRLGTDKRRTFLQTQAKKQLGIAEDLNEDITGALARIQNDDKDEQAYIELIYYYSKKKDQENTLKYAELLDKNVPDSDKAHLALYKIYLDAGRLRKGIRSMKKVFKSTQFDDETKVRVLNDFITTSTHDDELMDDVKDAIDVFSDYVENPEAFTALGAYYLEKKNDPSAALAFYEKGLEINDQDFDLIKKAALLSIDVKDYSKAHDILEKALSYFPAQPLFYLLDGVALNYLDKPDDAIERLESGMTYLLDEIQLERDIYQQLAISYDKKGNATQAVKMRSKAQELSKKL